MNVYLHDIPLAEARTRFEKALQDAGLFGLLGKEEVPLDEAALGRVLADPVWATISSPHYHASAMDGFAVRSVDTEGALPSAPIVLNCKEHEKENRAEYVDTGDPLPEWADSVIPIENVEPLDETGAVDPQSRNPYAIRIRASIATWNHVRSMGEDMVATQLVLPSGHVLRPVDLGAIAACGHSKVFVSKRPRVAVLPTGSELVPLGQAVKPGDIIEYNSLVLAAQVNSWGGQTNRLAITPDVFEDIQLRVAQAALENDLILLNAGSSAGSEDYSADVVNSLGDLLVHGVAVRPGHPVILGMIQVSKARELVLEAAEGHGPVEGKDARDKIPIIGVPGYPVSAALTGEIFVEPLLAIWLGRAPAETDRVTATLTRKVTSPAGDDDYMRVVVGRVGENLLAAPLARGSGVISSLVRADGIVIVPRGSQGYLAGASVKVNLYRSALDLERTVFATGSHDVSLDLLAQFLAGSSRRLVSSNVGSLGGLVALNRREAHLAGSHLLDPESGDYNLSYIHQYLSGIHVWVIAFVHRQQGLLLKKGNPLGVHSLSDLERSNVRFVNRQRGAGTRVLLDYHLHKLGIATKSIRGYNHEEYTHLAVAAAISSGQADCGMGIAAAAQALDLDFIPLFQERYEFIIPDEFYKSDLLLPLFDVMHDVKFQQAVAALPGYGVESMGTLVSEVKEQ